MRRFIVAVPLALFALLVAWFGFGLTRDPQTLPSALIDRPVPDFALAPLAPREAGLASPDIGGPQLVNVFASWCAPCRVEHPLLMELAASGVRIDGIAYKDAPEDAAGFLARLGDPYRLVGLDPEGLAAIEWGVYGVPETFVIGPDNRILLRHVGPLDEAAIAALKPLLARSR